MTLTFEAGPGEANHVVVGQEGPAHVVSDTGAAIVAGPGCVAVTAAKVSCANVGLLSMNVELGDGDDFVDIDSMGSGAPTLLSGGPGDDELSGGLGNDTMRGGPGADRIDAGGCFCFAGFGETADYSDHAQPVTVNLQDPGRDGGVEDGIGDEILSAYTVIGGIGNDVITGRNSTRDNLYGGPGDDTLNGGNEADTIADKLYGDDGDDSLNAGNGADILEGGAGADVLDGGVDIYADFASYEDHAAAVTIDLGDPGADGGSEDGPGDTLTHIDSIWGGAGDDVLGGDAAVNTLDGKGGDDQLDGAAGNDGIAGGAGDDELDGGSGADYFSGGPGFDLADFSARTSRVTVTLDPLSDDGEAGESDNVGSNNDIEHVKTGTGDDDLIGRIGGDVLAGGPGDDRLVDTTSPYGDGADTLNGGTGTDTADYSGRFISVTIRLNGSPDDGSAGEADNVGTDVERALGGGESDVLVGSPASDILEGNAGNDVLDGGLGSDLLVGGLGHDVADYSERAGSVEVDLADEGDDGEPGENDIIRDFEELWGGDGDDILVGSSGDDTFSGGAGADVLDGGVGDSSNGFDLVDYSDRDEDVFADLDGEAGDDGEAGEGDTLASDLEAIAGGAGDDELGGHGGANELDGGAGDDLLDGGLGPDELIGGTGYDAIDYFGWTMGVWVDLDGVTGDDGAPGEFDTVHSSIEAVFGGNGNDVLTGNGGDNILFGRAGVDLLYGDGGEDILNGGLGPDQLSGGAGFDLADYSDRTTGVSVDLDGVPDDGALGEGDSVPGDIEDLQGGAGDDVLVGNDGENFLFGLGGNDTLDGAGASDLLVGGVGDDKLLTRDGELDEGDCGGGAGDSAVADWLDAITDCEQVARPTPTATTGAANPTANAVVLVGFANPNGNATTVHWQLGPTTAYGTSSAPTAVGSGFSDVPVSTVLLGLQPSTTYHYRLVATNGGGTTYGFDRTFTTLASAANPPPPPPPVRRCVVPRVVGKNLRPARRAITKGRCRVGKITRRHSRVVRSGLVLAQKPRAGSRHRVGTRVSLVVSRGRRR